MKKASWFIDQVKKTEKNELIELNPKTRQLAKAPIDEIKGQVTNLAKNQKKDISAKEQLV